MPHVACYVGPSQLLLTRHGILLKILRSYFVSGFLHSLPSLSLVGACRFVQVLVALLSGATGGLAGAAADVLAEIVLKRMDAAAKLRCALPSGQRAFMKAPNAGHSACRQPQGPSSVSLLVSIPQCSLCLTSRSLSSCEANREEPAARHGGTRPN